MFGFLKKKKDDSTSKNQAKEKIISISEEEKFKILSQIDEESNLLTNSSDKHEKAVILEKIGLLHDRLGNEELSIQFLEESLENEISMGDGYKKLMSLYNSKRAQAAKNKDNDGIDYYMNKMDEMRNIAKKATLTR